MHAQVSDHAGPGNRSRNAIARVAFRHIHNVGALNVSTFAAQYWAYMLPCRRFTVALTDADARLGVDVDRYSFIVKDFHLVLLAGLPAHVYFEVAIPGRF
jgi:hypothetical protein